MLNKYSMAVKPQASIKDYLGGAVYFLAGIECKTAGDFLILSVSCANVLFFMIPAIVFHSIVPCVASTLSVYLLAANGI